MESFKFADIHTLASTIIIGAKKGDDGEHTKASAMHSLIKMVHKASTHLHVDPNPMDGPPPDEQSFKTMKMMFDYVFIYPDCKREVFERTLKYVGVDDVEASIEQYYSETPDLPLVLCLNRVKIGTPIQLKAMKA